MVWFSKLLNLRQAKAWTGVTRKIRSILRILTEDPTEKTCVFDAWGAKEQGVGSSALRQSLTEHSKTADGKKKANPTGKKGQGLDHITYEQSVSLRTYP